MKRIFSLILAGCLLLGSVVSAGAEGGVFANDKPSPLLVAPVNVGIAGGAILPKGMLLTAINASFRDKTHHEGPEGPASDVFSQLWLLKVRYGLFDRMEVSVVTPYVNNDIDNQFWRPEGFGDVTVGTSLALLSERAGHPLWVTLGLGLALPTGDEHLAGAGSLGGRVSLSWSKNFTKNIMAAGDFVWETPLGRGHDPYAGPGNTRFDGVRRGDKYTATAHVRYRFNYFDLGLETIYEKSESGTGYLRNSDDSANMKNGTTEWVVGPSMNFAIDPVKMWVGVGAFFPVYQDAKGPTKMEDVRWEFKVGKTW